MVDRLYSCACTAAASCLRLFSMRSMKNSYETVLVEGKHRGGRESEGERERLTPALYEERTIGPEGASLKPMASASTVHKSYFSGVTNSDTFMCFLVG